MVLLEVLLDSFASISRTENDSDVILFKNETERCSIYTYCFPEGGVKPR